MADPTAEVRTVEEFDRWIKGLIPSDTCRYHIGHLARDCATDREARAVRSLVQIAIAKELVTTFQKPVTLPNGTRIFAYIAKRLQALPPKASLRNAA